MSQRNRPATLTEDDRQVTAGGFKILPVIFVLIVLAVSAFFVHRLVRPAPSALEQAVTLIKQGKAAAALPTLEQLSTQHPANPDVFPWLAQGYLSTDRIAEGRIALDTALRIGLPPKDLAPTIILYANFYQRKGDYEEAEKLLRTVPSDAVSEDLARFYTDWADSELANGDIEAAVTHLEAASQLTGSISEALRSSIPHRLSEGYRRLAALAETKENNDQKAIELLEKSLKVSDEPATRMILASIYQRVNTPDKAIENYRIVATLDKNNLEARHHLIDLLLDKGDFDGAQKALVELTDKEKSVENYQQLANADIKLKNYAGAVHALEDACDLRLKPETLKQLLTVLNDWQADLTKDKKLQEANSVKGHADRVAEQLAQMAKAERDAEQDKLAAQNAKVDSGHAPPIALSSSRTWLAVGSVTPEGEIKIRNISGKPVSDLTLKAVFYDNTAKQTSGSVSLPVATPSSQPLAANDSRTLYFSCPNVVKTDHQLAVIIMWKDRLLKEFPVQKQL